METEKKEKEIEIDLLEILLYFLKNIWIIIIITVIIVGGIFVFNKLTQKEYYESTTKIYVVNSADGENITSADTALATQQVEDIKEIITSRSVVEEAINNCELDTTYEEMVKNITVSNTEGTHIVGITAKADAPKTAQLVASEIRDIATEKIKSVMFIKIVNVVEEANLPDKAKTEEPVLSTKKAAALGVVVGIIVVAIRFAVDDRIKNAKQAEKYLEIPILSQIPVIKTNNKA